MKTNGENPINPTTYEKHGTDSIGLTKREYFAAMAMQGFINVTVSGCPQCRPVITKESTFDDMAFLAVQAADDLIKSLNEKAGE